MTNRFQFLQSNNPATDTNFGFYQKKIIMNLCLGSNLCYSMETTIVHFSILCFYCDYVNLVILIPNTDLRSEADHRPTCSIRCRAV